MKIINLNLQLNGNIILNNITLNFLENKIIGLIGPNGCGKTSLFKCISNLIITHTGEISNHKKIAAHLNHDGFFKNLSGNQNLLFYGSLKNKPNLYPLLKFDFFDKKFKNMSLGMKQMLSISEVLQKDADIYLLDEPFNGLDILHRNILKKEILELKNKNKTIIISSHDVNLLQQIVDEVIFLQKGKVLFSGQKEELLLYYDNLEQAAIQYFHE